MARAQSGCVVEPRGCPFLDVQAGAAIAVHGTVHAPLARITADFGHRAAFRFMRGAVLRSFRGDDAPDDPQFTPFRLPPSPQGPYADRFVVLTARIDCNSGRRTWKSAGPSEIAFGPLALTRKQCAPGSMHDQIVKQWGNIRSYVIRDGHLFLALLADGGIYEFAPIVSRN